MIKPIIQVAIILVVFYEIEAASVYFPGFPIYNMLLCADIVLRIIFGIVSFVLLKNYAKRGESKYPVKKFFTNRI